MASVRKSYYTNQTSSDFDKAISHLNRAADHMSAADYGQHAKSIKTMADHLMKSHGQPRTKDVVSSPDRKGRPRD